LLNYNAPGRRGLQPGPQDQVGGQNCSERSRQLAKKTKNGSSDLGITRETKMMRPGRPLTTSTFVTAPFFTVIRFFSKMADTCLCVGRAALNRAGFVGSGGANPDCTRFCGYTQSKFRTGGRRRRTGSSGSEAEVQSSPGAEVRPRYSFCSGSFQRSHTPARLLRRLRLSPPPSRFTA
jgi:hypothetical protein